MATLPPAHTTTRRLVYQVAATIDNFIAREDESVDGMIMEGPHVADYVAGLRDYDTVLMGARTYQWGYQFGMRPGEPVPTYAHMMQYVFSRRMDSYQHDRLKVVREDPAQFVRELKERDGGPIYLCGGGSLAGYLLDHELVDELLLKLHPVAFGAGIRLFGGNRKELGASLISTKVYHNSVVYLHYVLRYAGMAAGS